MISFVQRCEQIALLGRSSATIFSNPLGQSTGNRIPRGSLAQCAQISCRMTGAGAHCALVTGFRRLAQCPLCRRSVSMANIQPTPVLSPPPRIGGQELTILSTTPTSLHHSMVVVGLPYSFEGQSRYDEITGCSPYGASTITRADGTHMPSENELAGARFQGRHVAQMAAKTSGGRAFQVDMAPGDTWR